jgi:hypothetical protein
VLHRFLAYGSVEWPEEFAEVEGGHLAGADGADAIVVTTAATSWTVRPTPAAVTVTDGRADGARAEVTAGPDAMLRWLWGRSAADAVTVTGDQAWATYLRRLLAAGTV